jgi:hypothetical protein
VAASGGGASARNRRREMAAHGCARRAISVAGGAMAAWRRWRRVSIWRHQR